MKFKKSYHIYFLKVIEMFNNHNANMVERVCGEPPSSARNTISHSHHMNTGFITFKSHPRVFAIKSFKHLYLLNRYKPNFLFVQ